jgi:hypothetical protein
MVAGRTGVGHTAGAVYAVAHFAVYLGLFVFVGPTDTYM